MTQKKTLSKNLIFLIDSFCFDPRHWKKRRPRKDIGFQPHLDDKNFAVKLDIQTESEKVLSAEYHSLSGSCNSTSLHLRIRNKQNREHISFLRIFVAAPPECSYRQKFDRF